MRVMKKIITIIVTILLLQLSACDDENYGNFADTQVQIEKSDVIFTASGGTGSIVIADDEQSFSATSNENWCKISISGNSIIVTVEPNLSMLGRTAMITISSGERRNYVPVSQDPVYLVLDSYDDVVFLGKGGTLSFPYECTANVPIKVIAEAQWITAAASDGMIVMTAATNTNFLESRNTTIRIVAGEELVSLELGVVQGELMTSYEPDPGMNTIGDFLNLMNAGTNSRYTVVYYSARLAELYDNLKAAYPIFNEIRIQAPRGSHKLSIILHNVEGEVNSYYYWNATNGLIPLEGSTTVGVFAVSSNTYSGTAAPYTSNINYTQLREFFTSSAGFTVFPDLESEAFWFRSVSNPMDYIKVEPVFW